MEIIVNPLTSLVQRSMDKLIDECYFCCCFNPIVGDFKKEKGNLVAAEKRVQKDVETARNTGEQIEEEVEKWLLDAKSLIEEDTETKQKWIFKLCPNCIWRYRQGKDLSRKTVDVTKLIEKSNFTKVGRPVQGPGIKFHSSTDYMDFESRKSEKKQLLDALADRSSYLIGLQGMGGCGKSYLVKQVGNQVQNLEPKLFDRVIYVVVSSTPDVRKIQQDIARHLGLNLEEGKELEHPEKLWSRLANGEKILIILDDVWEELVLKDIGIPLGEDHNGCCVLITTRNIGVCNSMNCQRQIQLKTLSKKDAWILFKTHATQVDDDLSNDFNKVGQKIVKKCQNLPVVIAAVASTLKCQSIQRWQSVLTSLSNAKPTESTDKGLTKAYKILQLSYNYLKSEEAKRLFLLCSLFPEDYEIPIEDLTRFGIGLGLFGEDDDSYEILRAKVVSTLGELVESCLLLQPSHESVSMHDLIRDVAQWIANHDIQSIMGPRGNMQKKSIVRYLYCYNIDDFPKWLSECAKLELLTVIIESKSGIMEIPEAFFERMEGLKVLQLVWKYPWRFVFNFPKIERKLNLFLPQLNKLLVNLRTLRVDGCDLADISFLEKLEKLETLELRFCYVNELPDGIVKLDKLRLLHLTMCILKKNPWKVISRLSKIEELCIMGNVADRGSEWNINTGFSAGLFDKNRVVQMLQRYKLDMIERPTMEFYDITEVSRILLVNHFPGFASHATIIDLVRRAESLQLNRIEGDYRSVIPDLVAAIGDMNELIELGLGSCSIEYLIDTTTTTVSSQKAIIFNKLVKLNLKSMYQLRELCHGTTPSNLFGELQNLIISGCHKLDGGLFARNLNLSRLEELYVDDCSILNSLFTLSTATSLVELNSLEIENCNQLKHIIAKEQEEEKGKEINDDDHQKQIYNSIFPKLNHLTVIGGNQLEFIFPFSSVLDLSSLEFIQLEDCSQLKYLFGPYPNKDQLFLLKDKEIMLPACKVLRLSYLPNFISFLPEDVPEATQLEITTQSVSQISHSEWFGGLKQPLTFCNIRDMRIVNCQKLVSLFALPTETMFLEELYIEGCDSLRHIIENRGDYHDPIKHGFIFPKLGQLDVNTCKLLEFIFPVAFSRNLVSLESIFINDAPKLKYVFGVDLSHNQNLETKIHIPKLTNVRLQNLPNITNICEANCYTTWPTLESFHLQQCPFLTITCINEFLVGSNTTQLGRTTRKEALLKETMKLLDNLKYLHIGNTKIEGIFNVKGLAMERQVNSKLQRLTLLNLPDLRYIFMGPKHIFSFSNCEQLVVKGCRKLKSIFSVSVLKSLPQLGSLQVEDCQDLEQIVEENQNVSNPHNQQVCFPMLSVVVVKHCGNLKSLFSISNDSAFPELQLLFVEYNSELKQVFASEQGRTNERKQIVLPKLKYLVLKDLPSLHNDVSLGIQFRPVEFCIAKGCHGLTFSSTTTFLELKNHFDSLDADTRIGKLYRWELAVLIGVEDYEAVESHDEESVNSDDDSENENSNPKDVETQVEDELESHMPSSEPQELASKEARNEMRSCEELGAESMKETDKGIVHQCPMSEEPAADASTSSQDINSIKEKEQESTEPEKARKGCQESLKDIEKGIVQQCPTPEEPAKEDSTPSQEINSIKEKWQESPKLEKAICKEYSEEMACKDHQERRKTRFDMGVGEGSILENVKVGSGLEKPKIASSSIHSETRSSDQEPLVTCLHETSPKEFIAQEPTNQQNVVEQAHEENKRTHQIIQKDDKPSDQQHMKRPSNEKKTALQISSTIPELKGSAVTSRVTFPKKISPLISSIPKMSTAGSPSSNSGLILQPEALQELKTELDAYLNMSLEVIFESNAFDNVERIINSLARGTADVIQRNILEDLASRLKNLKECIPQAMNTKQSSFEFMSNYENRNMELNTKLSEGQGRVRDLESKFSGTCEEEYAIEMEMQQLITRKFEILARKNSLASQLDQSSQEVSKNCEEWKALGEQLKLSTDQWLKSKEVLAHANASWRVFKESLRL